MHVATVLNGTIWVVVVNHRCEYLV